MKVISHRLLSKMHQKKIVDHRLILQLGHPKYKNFWVLKMDCGEEWRKARWYYFVYAGM
jgi:hypothetical protein